MISHSYALLVYNDNELSQLMHFYLSLNFVKNFIKTIIFICHIKSLFFCFALSMYIRIYMLMHMCVCKQDDKSMVF